MNIIPDFFPYPKMPRVDMEKTLCVEPKHLDENIMTHIKEKLATQIVGSCDQNHGYISKVYDDVKIIENIVSSAGPGVFFRVKFTAKAMKPEVGGTYTGKICMIFATGIFAEVDGKIKVLIPSDKLTGYRYSKSGVYKKGSAVLSVGQDIEFRIDMIRYDKQNFSCIGSLKDI